MDSDLVDCREVARGGGSPVKSGIQQFFLTSTFVLALVPLPGKAGTIDYTYSFSLAGLRECYVNRCADYNGPDQ